MKKQKNKLDRYILLNWKKTAIALIVFLGSCVLHNFLYGLIKFFLPAWEGDEPFFFIVAVIGVPLYFAVSITYTIFRKIRG